MYFHEFLRDGEAEAEAFDVLHLALELHIRADASDLLGRKSSTRILHRKFRIATFHRQPDADK